MKSIKEIQIPLYYKIMLSFLLLLVIIAIVSSFSGRIARNSMKSYFDQRVEGLIEQAVTSIVEEISSSDWKIDDPLFHDHLKEGFFSKSIKYDLLDVDGRVVMSSARILQNTNDQDRYDGPRMSGFEPVFIEREVPIVIDGEIFGSLRVKYFDAMFMSDNDIKLYESIADVFKYMIVGIFFICLLISFVIARGITKPIKVVGMTANKISEGDLKVRAHVKTNTKELIALSEDINLLAAQLEQEDILRSQVTSDMAHEIRTPLTSLRNFFEAFMDGVYEVNEENLEKCHTEIIRMSELIDRLKDIANIEAMTITSKPCQVDLGEEIKSICDFSMPAFDKKGISLQYDVATQCTMQIDPNQFKQTITNLITNGLRYTDEGGMVKVELAKTKTTIKITVSDNGIGMSEEDVANIFERFYRADKSRDRATGGIGVGLTIVKKMTEYYNGTVSVESTLGVGSKFVIQYPQ